MEYTALIILIALIQFLWFGARVGLGRGKYGVKAPSTTGNENFQRLYRVQQNTMEQLVIFIPAVVAFSVYVSDVWVLLPGLAFVIARALYSYEYTTNPDSRTPGMGLTLLSNVALIVGALIGMFFN